MSEEELPGSYTKIDAIDSTGLYQGAVVDVNSAVAANVDAAVAAATGLRFVGYSVRESDGTPAVATATIVKGTTGAGGTVLAIIELAANGFDTKWFGPEGLDVATGGISINHLAGTLDVMIYTKTITS